MRQAQARTFFGSVATLVIAGFAATALPFIIALVAGSIQVNRLTGQSERTILDSARTTRATEFVADELVSMERNARQFAVLKDPGLLRLYEERYVQLLDTLTQLGNIDFGADNRQTIAAIRKLATTITLALERKPLDMAQLEPALAQFTPLRADAARLRRASDTAMDREVASLTASSAMVQHNFLWQSSLLGLSGLVLAILFIATILKPIRQINQTISRLGEERFDQPIAVEGPRDLREIGERLDWLRERLQQAEQQKNEFVRHMSHELKTPLANIRESTGLLLDNAVGRLSAGQRDIVSILDNSGRRLHLLVDNLINLARWREHHAMHVTRFELGELLDAAVKEHRLLFERRKLRLAAARPDAVWVHADRERFKTILANLLSNAIKYSPEEGTIDVRIYSRNEDLYLEISDEGPGIPSADHERVFEPFYQSDNGTKIEGTGIGLSLVRECLEAHNGCGGFLPSEKGARFRARLPIVERASANA